MSSGVNLRGLLFHRRACVLAPFDEVGDRRLGDADVAQVLRHVEVVGQLPQRGERLLGGLAVGEAVHVLAHGLAELAEPLQAGEHVELHDPRQHQRVGDAVRHVEHAADGIREACTAPTPALPKAMPPIIEPMAMLSRAHMLVPSYTAVRMLLLMSLMPS